MSTNAVILMTDSLRALGLKHLLETSFSITANIVRSTQIIEAMGDNVDFIFTDSLTLSRYMRFFIPRQLRTIVVNDNDVDDSDVTMLCSSNDLDVILARLETFLTCNDIDNSAGEGNGILSRRETEVLRLIASGFINKEIAEKLNISINTVLTHRKNITAKLGIKSASGLSFYALMNGIIAPK